MAESAAWVGEDRCNTSRCTSAPRGPTPPTPSFTTAMYSSTSAGLVRSSCSSGLATLRRVDPTHRK